MMHAAAGLRSAAPRAPQEAPRARMSRPLTTRDGRPRSGVVAQASPPWMQTWGSTGPCRSCGPAKPQTQRLLATKFAMMLTAAGACVAFDDCRPHVSSDRRADPPAHPAAAPCLAAFCESPIPCSLLFLGTGSQRTAAGCPPWAQKTLAPGTMTMWLSRRTPSQAIPLM